MTESCTNASGRKRIPPRRVRAVALSSLYPAIQSFPIPPQESFHGDEQGKEPKEEDESCIKDSQKVELKDGPEEGKSRLYHGPA